LLKLVEVGVANELLVGKPRLGWLVDGDPSTPHVAVMLQDTGDEIELTVPLQGLGSAADPYQRWFASGMQYGDDPEHTKFLYAPPKQLLFQDGDGSVALVGCRSAGFSTNMGAGRGRILPGYAVFGGERLDYNHVNGMRTVLPALALWTGLRSVHVEAYRDHAARVQRMAVSLESPAEEALARTHNLTLWPSWTTESDEFGTFTAHNVVGLQTSLARPKSFVDLFATHTAVRDLLSVSAWESFGFSDVWVHRTDDPERSLSGELLDERWSRVASARIRKHQGWSASPRFLFNYLDVGSKGVRRWLALRRKYVEAIQPLVGLVDQRSMFLETRMVQSGIALEALGYQLAIDHGMNPRTKPSFKKCLDLILDDLPLDPSVAAREAWKTQSTDCYMGVKHPDRPTPDFRDLYGTLRQHLLVLRLWIAGRLGVAEETLRPRLTLDPHAREVTFSDA
jgi:hypothetical protein